tara:strand:+ start:114 stop:902 length:789 start_codon:yes stop_codon:yes gene_type:complete
MIKAKKSLGQNFLVNQDVIKKIVNIVDIDNKDVLEVGPGTGNLTSEILKRNPNKFLVVEKDNELANKLLEKFSSNIKIINEDILEINENDLNNQILTVFGNLPYNISTEILIKWILNLNEKKIWFNYLVLMFQKEVANRIIAKYNTREYGRLSILTNWRLKVKKVCDVSPSCFQPKPKVESSLLLFEPKENFFDFINSKNLEKITNVFFMHRRKMIKKPYKQLFKNNTDIAYKLGINLNVRPQNLDPNTYFELTKEYEFLRR